MSAPVAELVSAVEMPQTRHGGSLYQVAEGRRHEGQYLRHPRIIFTQNPVKTHNFAFIDCVLEMPVTENPTPYLKNITKLLLASNLAEVSVASS